MVKVGVAQGWISRQDENDEVTRNDLECAWR